MRPRIPLSPPCVGPRERELLLEAFDSTWVTPIGPHVDALERELAERVGVSHALALCSGTAALHLALEVLGVGPDDEVWVSTLTFAATAFAVCYRGARPVFVDCDAESWTLDPHLLRESLERRARAGRLPKAIIAVDLYGQCADYAAIREACQRHGVALVQDAAEALGSTYRGQPAGSQGDLAVVSFNGNKIVTGGGGGALLSNHRPWMDRARHLAGQARQPTVHYEHLEVGYNYQPHNLVAAIVRAQLSRLDDFVRRRRAIHRYYREALQSLPGWQFMPEHPRGQCTFWLTCATIDSHAPASRDEVLAHLTADRIESRPVWKPMHLQPVFRDCERLGGTVAERLFEQGLCLPSGSGLTPSDLVRITERIRATPPRHTQRGA